MKFESSKISQFAYLFIFILLLSLESYSSMPNYNSILVGDQAAGMGGAYTAMTEDPSALPWYNPATMAWLKEEAFSASVGIYKKYDTSYQKSQSLIDAAFQANQGYFKPIPSSTASIVRFNKEKFEISKVDLLEYAKGWTFGLSILVPYSDQFKGTLNNANNDQSTLNFSDEHLWVGGAAAKTISDHSAFGFTIYYTSRSLSKTVNDTTYVNSSNFTIFNEDKTLKQNHLVLLLGYHRKLNPNWNMGISARLPGHQIYGKGTLFQNTITNSGYTPSSIIEVDAKDPIPSKYTIGFSYDVPYKYTLAADLSYYPGNYGFTDIDKPGYEELITVKDVLNVSLGGEYHWNEYFKIRAGVFTNYSAYPEPDINKSRGISDHVDQNGFSANMALKKGNIQYTFGGYYTGGAGSSVQRINQTYTVTPKTQHVFTMMIGTTYLY